MMRPRTLSTALIWLAALALAAQGLGASAFLEACQCQACECGQQIQTQSCCGSHVAPIHVAKCGQSCCQTPSRDCTLAVRIPGSCCCEAEPTSPANLPKTDQAGLNKLLLQVSPVFGAADAPLPTLSVILLTEVRHESPPPRILYCVWRI